MALRRGLWWPHAGPAVRRARSRARGRAGAGPRGQAAGPAGPAGAAAGAAGQRRPADRRAVGRRAGGPPGQRAAGPDRPAAPHLRACCDPHHRSRLCPGRRPDEVDVIRFEQLVARGRRLAEAGQAADASAALGEALGLRRGEPLADFTYAGLFEPNGPGSTSWSWWRSRPAPEQTWRWAATASSPPDWRPGAGRTAARAPVGTAHPGAVPGRAPGRGPAGLHRSPRPPGRRARHRPRARPARP